MNRRERKAWFAGLKAAEQGRGAIACLKCSDACSRGMFDYLTYRSWRSRLAQAPRNIVFYVDRRREYHIKKLRREAVFGHQFPAEIKCKIKLQGTMVGPDKYCTQGDHYERN